MESLKEIFRNNKYKIALPPAKNEGFKVSFLSREKTNPGTVLHASATTCYSPKTYDVKLPVYGGGNVEPQLPFAETDVHEVEIVGSRALCTSASSAKHVYELSLDIQGTPLADYCINPGDTIGIISSNRKRDVEFVLMCMDLVKEGDLTYVIEHVESKAKVPKHIPVESTLRHAFTYCVELRAVVKKLFLRALSTCCTLREERKCLELLCSENGADLYIEHVVNKNISLVDILQAFRSCQPSPTCLLAHLPRLLPRPYSIANSRLENENIIKICFSVINNPDKKGLTTERLEQIALHKSRNRSLIDDFNKLTLNGYQSKIKIYKRKNCGFSFPDESKSVLMVGPGTGVAPYIGFLEQRRQLKKRTPSLHLGETWLFYGCRDGKTDFIYKEEVDRYLDEKILSRLTCSYSRVENSDCKYVQDAIKLHGKEVAEFIKAGGYVFVCGDLSTVAKQVEEAFAHCLQPHTGRTYEGSVAFIRQMQKCGKYILDVWT